MSDFAYLPFRVRGDYIDGVFVRHAFPGQRHRLEELPDDPADVTGELPFRMATPSSSRPPATPPRSGRSARSD